MASSDAALSGGTRRFLRKPIIFATAVFAAAAAWFGYEDLKLAATMAVAAGDAYPDGVDAAGGLRIDFRQSLVQHPPTKLARCLKAPSARWRAVACQALQSANRDTARGDWKGVAVQLMRTALADPCQEVSSRAFDALLYVPDWGRDEAVEMLQLLDGASGGDVLRAENVLVQRSRANLVQRAEMFAFWQDSPLMRRRIHCVSATSADASMLETAKKMALDIAATCNPADVPTLAEAMGPMLTRRPEFGEAFFNAGSAAQAAALLSLDRQHYASLSASNQKLIAAAKVAAIGGMRSGDERLREASAKYISHTPDGPAVLVRELLAAMPDQRHRIAAAIEHCQFGPAANPVSAADCERLVQLWPNLQGDSRRCVGRFLARGIRVSTLAKFNSPVFPTGVGPRNPSSATIFRRLLDDDEVAGLTEPFFEHVAPLPEQDVPLVAKWMRNAMENRGAEMHRAKVANGQRDVDDYPEGLFDYFRLLRSRFPMHPEIEMLKRQYPALESNS